MLFSALPLVSRSFERFLYIPPWFSAIAISLSLTIMIRLESSSLPATFKASMASPPDKEPSPMSAITFLFSPFKSLALTSPVASEIDVDVCPTLNKSCSLSSGLV